MSSADSDAPSSSPPSLEELTTRSAAALLLPWVLGLTADRSTATTANREVMVFVHQPTRSVALMEGSSDIDSILSELIAAKEGPPPASKSSIDSLPRVVLSRVEGFECPICLEEHEGGDGDDVEVEVKEMPCKHKFHVGCIDKWLGKRGTCPVCRFGMPAEEEKKVDEMNGWRVHVLFARGRDSGSDTGSGSGEQDDRDHEYDYDSGDDLSAQAMEMDD